MAESRRASEKIGAWVQKALDGTSEAMEFEVTVMPDAQGTPALAVLFWAPSPLLGQALTLVLMIGNPLQVDEEGIGTAVHQIVEQARAQRSQMLAQSNGHGQPGQGLITP